MFKNIDEQWLSWLVEQEEDALICSNFKLIKPPLTNRIYVPRLWVEGLAEKYSWLHILRTPHHRPKDPFELVDFIKTLEL